MDLQLPKILNIKNTTSLEHDSNDNDQFQKQRKTASKY